MANLIDDTEGTQWTAEGTITAGNLTVDGRKATIDLAGTEPVGSTVSRSARTSRPGRAASRRCASSRCGRATTAVRRCTTTRRRRTARRTAGYTKVYTSPANAFPAIRRGRSHRT